MIVFIALLVFVTIILFVVALLYKDPQQSVMKERMESAAARPLTPAEKMELAQKKLRDKKRKEPSVLLTWLSGGLGKQVNRFLPSNMLVKLESKILMAGHRGIKVTDILAIKGALPFVAIVLATILFSPKGQFDPSMAGKSLMMTLVMVTVAFFLPDIFFGQEISKRHNLIMKSLPFTVDMIKICVEAGLDLDGAFTRIINKSSGPLVDELERALYEIRMGKERSLALNDLSSRVGLSDLSSFVSVLVQSEKAGMSIGQVLETQSNEMRIKQSQRAREKAAKIPVLMMLPMVIFILPAMFLVILGPAMIQIMTTLGPSM